jgi:dolichyl-phosphate beta-glucosyltransferase
VAQPSLIRSCALIVPCYNESQRLRVDTYVEFLRAAPEGFTMVFVDDGSKDNTLQVLESLRARAQRGVVVLPKSPNAGKADAVRHGMNYAMEHLHPSVTGFWDADLATPLREIYPMTAVLEEQSAVQMVFGARVKLLGRRIVRKPERHYLGRVFATVVSNVLRLPVYDTQCGAKLFRVSDDLRQVLREPFLSRWIFDVEIVARFIRMRGPAYVESSIYEYPLSEWEDVAGSKVRPGDFLKAILEVVEIWNSNLRGRRDQARSASHS